MSDPIADTPAPEPNSQAALNALTPEDRASYDLTGEWPEPSKVTTTATPETDDDEPAVTTTSAEPAVAPAVTTTTTDKAYTPPSPKSKRSQRDQEFINERIRTSVQEATAALQAELAALKSGKPATEPAKPAEATAAVVDPSDPEPTEDQFDTYGAFVLAAARWATRQAKREADAETKKTQAEHAQHAQREAFQAAQETWVSRRESFTAKHPDKAERLLAFLDDVTAGTPIGDVIMESEVGAEVADYLAEHKDEADRIARLAPISALRALGKLEAKFDSTLTSASASAGPAAKTVTTAPAPPMTLTSRSAAPADPAAAALERGDFAAWEAEENRKALAASR